jgi:hypothetical protein
MPTASVLALALVVAAAQHSRNLCQIADHGPDRTRTVAAPECPKHGGSSAADRQPQNEQSPACCGPMAAIVALPSLKATVASTMTSGPAFPLRVKASGLTVFGGPGDPLPGRARDEGRQRSRFPGLRSHLTFRTILV